MAASIVLETGQYNDGSSVGASVFGSAFAVFQTVEPSTSLVVVDISVLEIVRFDCASIAGPIGNSSIIYQLYGLAIIIIIII